MVVIHPVGRFTTAKTPEQWRDACYWTLLAYCNHGQECRTTFTDAEQFNGLSSEGLEQLAENFIMAPTEERRAMAEQIARVEGAAQHLQASKQEFESVCAIEIAGMGQ